MARLGRGRPQRQILTRQAVLADLSVVLEQEGFHFRNDDGSESAATFIGAQDSDTTRGKSLNTRLRILVDASGDPDTAQLTLQYRKVGDADSEWRAVPLT